MSTITQHATGTFCWPELASTDQSSARKFYTALFGWQAQEFDMGNGATYTTFLADGEAVGALHQMQKDQLAQGIPPHWLSYVSVESADATAQRAVELGGKKLMEPFDVFDMGRMAAIQDPTGATFALWQPKSHIGVTRLGDVGALCWTELMTTDAAKAQAFYTGLFGWKAEAMPASNMNYTILKNGGNSAGGMAQITPEMGGMPSNWGVYYRVEDCDASVAKAIGLGAKVLMPAMDVPTVGRMATLADPQGAAFSVIRLDMPA